jgi:hypothetical protein
MQQLLSVYWPRRIVEYVSFDEDNFQPQMKTSERWTDGTVATYDVDAKFTRRGKSRTLELIYEQANQTDRVVKDQDRLVPGDVRYGVSTITWTAGAPVGKIKWKDRKEYVWNGKVAVLGGQRVEITKRAKKSVLMTLRPGQAAFRDGLIQLDKRCVLTGEDCPEALQAAHILPVAKNGHEQIENGILLRADLHLLFDAGLIWFELADDHAAVDYSNDLTAPYLALLKGKRLPEKTFGRVRAAMLKRSKLPGGRGRGVPK